MKKLLLAAAAVVFTLSCVAGVVYTRTVNTGKLKGLNAQERVERVQALEKARQEASKGLLKVEGEETPDPETPGENPGEEPGVNPGETPETPGENPGETPETPGEEPGENPGEDPGKDPVVVPDNAQEVPVTFSLKKNDDPNLALYTTIDANEDGQSWKIGGLGSGSAILTSNAAVIDGSDDWLVTLPVHLLSGKTYKVSYELCAATSTGKGAVGEISVGIGTEPTVESLCAKILAPCPEYKGTATTSHVFPEESFTVEADGYYYVALYAKLAKGNNARVCDLKVEEYTVPADPPAAGKMEVTPFAKGELKAHVKYTAPLLTVAGEEIDGVLSKVEFEICWGASKHVVEEVIPGDVIEFDADMLECTPYTNNNRVVAVAYDADGNAGEECLVEKIYTGLDNPFAPENVKATVSSDFKTVTLSWDPVPEVGENGGYVDPAKVVYYVFDAFGSYYDPAIATTDKTYVTIDYSTLAKQDVAAYQVTAGMEETYYSMATNSNVVWPGPADELAFTESFRGAGIDNTWMVDPESTTSNDEWFFAGCVTDETVITADDTYLTSQDGDNGFFFAMPLEKDAVYGIVSGKINTQGHDKAALEFWYQGKGSNLEVLIGVDGGELQPVKVIKLKENPTDGWTLCNIPLTSSYWTAKYLQFGFRITAVDNTEEETYSVMLDNIRVMQKTWHNLRLVSVDLPESVNANEPALIKAHVENVGTIRASGTLVKFFNNDKKLVEIPLDPVEPNCFVDAVYSMPTNVTMAGEHVISAEIKFADDDDKSNNTGESSFYVNEQTLPGVENLTATTEGNDVILSWDEPNLTELKKNVTVEEDFESSAYPNFTISDFGGWTMYDGDKQRTYTFLKDYDNPYITQPQAFELYTPTLSGMPENYYADCTPHSGDRMLVAFSAEGKNDNWLISPKLSGAKQTVSFFAKAFTMAYPETVEVLYSTTDNNPASFQAIETVNGLLDGGIVPEDWTELKAELPEGAKYFAIRHTADDSYALYVDDITFEKGSIIPADAYINGHNLFRGGFTINEKPLPSTPSTTYNVYEYFEGNYTYTFQVSPLYSHGEEGKASAPLTVNVYFSGIDSITADEAANADAVYYNLQGQRVINPTVGSIVIEQRDKRVRKVLIK